MSADKQLVGWARFTCRRRATLAHYKVTRKYFPRGANNLTGEIESDDFVKSDGRNIDFNKPVRFVMGNIPFGD
jgi:hypothetical protein